jgi:hypothetical protein
LPLLLFSEQETVFSARRSQACILLWTVMRGLSSIISQDSDLEIIGGLPPGGAHYWNGFALQAESYTGGTLAENTGFHKGGFTKFSVLPRPIVAGSLASPSDVGTYARFCANRNWSSQTGL